MVILDPPLVLSECTNEDPDVSVVAMSSSWSGAPDRVINTYVFSNRKIDHLLQEQEDRLFHMSHSVDSFLVARELHLNVQSQNFVLRSNCYNIWGMCCCKITIYEGGR